MGFFKKLPPPPRNRRQGDRGKDDTGKPWVGWTEESTSTAWTARCRYCTFSLSVMREHIPQDNYTAARALILRTRAGMIDHLSAKHLDRALR